MKPILLKLLLLLHVIFDISFTIISLGFYTPGWVFNLDDVFKTFHINDYNYMISPLDFVGLCLFRQVSLLVALIIVRRGKAERLKKYMTIYDLFGILGYMIAVVKLLVFDETSGFLKSPGVFMSVGSAVFLTFSLPFAIRKTLLGKKKEGAEYERLTENTETAANTNVENGLFYFKKKIKPKGKALKSEML